MNLHLVSSSKKLNAYLKHYNIEQEHNMDCGGEGFSWQLNTSHGLRTKEVLQAKLELPATWDCRNILKAGGTRRGRAEGSYVNGRQVLPPFFCLLFWTTPGSILSLGGRIPEIWQQLLPPFGLGSKDKQGLSWPYPCRLYWPPGLWVSGWSSLFDAG